MVNNPKSLQQNTFDIYDFDKTVYDGDCSLDFYKFCVRKQPHVVLYLPSQAFHAVLFVLHKEQRTTFKSHFFAFLKGVSNADEMVDAFWDTHYKNIKDWYMNANHSADVIISASPEFLLHPIAERLGVARLIATRMDPTSGVINGQNCRGKEKVSRLREAMGDIKVGKVYTDSRADMPLLDLAKERYLVKGNKVVALDKR